MKITIEQTHKHTLSQRQMQSLHILEVSACELDAFLTEQALENPFILYERPVGVLIPSLPSDVGENLDSYSDRLQTQHTPTLREFLLEQASDAGIPDHVRGCIRFLIENTDQHGYLDLTSTEAASLCGIAVQTAETAIRILQSFDPAGVGARDLRECLLLQEQRSQTPDKLMLTVIEQHLDLVAKHRYSTIARLCDVDEANIMRVVEHIRQLNPRPGNGFASAQDTPYAPPDLLVERDETGTLTVSLNPSIRFGFRVDAEYAAAMRRDCADDPDGRSYLAERLNVARAIDRGLMQRENTLLLCGKEILARQQAFFANPGAPLTPHFVREVADTLSCNASTVTRTLKNKTLYCARGTFPLSFFFCRPVCTYGTKTAAQVKDALQQMIAREPETAPYSDRELTERLQEIGIVISRRTVAKYREEIGIPGSFYRCGNHLHYHR